MYISGAHVLVVALVAAIVIGYVVYDGRLLGNNKHAQWEIGGVPSTTTPAPGVALTYTEVWRSVRGTIRVSDAALRSLAGSGFTGHLKDGVITLWERTCDGASKSCDKSDMYIQIIQRRGPTTYLITYSHTPDGSPRTYVLKDTAPAAATNAKTAPPATGAKGRPLSTANRAEPTPVTEGDYVAWQPLAAPTPSPRPKPPAAALRRT